MNNVQSGLSHQICGERRTKEGYRLLETSSIYSTPLSAAKKVSALFAGSYPQKLTSIACAKILCLLAGHLHRLDNQYFQTVSNQSLHLDMVSNRLASSASHSKHLGMVFAMVVSSMIDPNERALKFEGIDEDFETFIALATTNQKIGSITDLQSAPLCTETPFDSATPSEAQTRQKAPTVPMKQLTQTKIVAIEEVGKSDGDSDDEGMLPFAKPDTDESDEEDATLVQRNKPSAPVYVVSFTGELCQHC